jgi:3D (Asp-Asp-Asp) domain-containing protein
MFGMHYPYLLLLVLLSFACQQESKTPKFKELKVTATAFNSLSWQTDMGSPEVGAWGDSLKPSMKLIAVSRDLIDSGLVHNTKVIIKELNDTFLVKDKMHRRWKRKIDIYMGLDIQKARAFGKRELSIKWQVP